MLLSPTNIITAAGYFGIAATVFAESGLLFGIVLPGDSLLFTAGFLASQDVLQIVPLIIIIVASAILGDSTGYWFGRKFGHKVFSRPDSIFLNISHITKAEQFYREYGSKTLIIARFIPVIRTIAPIMAGVGKMHYSRFMSFNIIGAFIWGAGIPLMGYWAGHAIPNVDRYIIPVAILIIAISVAPGLWHLWRHKH